MSKPLNEVEGSAMTDAGEKLRDRWNKFSDEDDVTRDDAFDGLPNDIACDESMRHLAELINRARGGYVIVEARAVAPVDTRPQHAIDCEYQPKSAECEGIDCSCKETRLTRWNYDVDKQYMRVAPNGEWVRYVDLEAFRDKSEALNWKRQESCSECDGDGCAKCCRGCAGLREEIERLKRDLQYWADQDVKNYRENAELLKRNGEVIEDRRLTLNKFAAMEAELAALRERERSMRTCLETIRELGRVTMANETGREIILDSIGEALSAAPGVK